METVQLADEVHKQESTFHNIDTFHTTINPYMSSSADWRATATLYLCRNGC